MSRKHFKLCRSCLNFQKLKDNSQGGIYRYGFVHGFWNGELMCRYKLIPQNNRDLKGIEDKVSIFAYIEDLLPNKEE